MTQKFCKNVLRHLQVVVRKKRPEFRQEHTWCLHRECAPSADEWGWRRRYMLPGPDYGARVFVFLGSTTISPMYQTQVTYNRESLFSIYCKFFFFQSSLT